MKKKELTRKCPNCKIGIKYSNVSNFNSAEKESKCCKKCSQGLRFKNSVKRNPDKWSLKCRICGGIKNFKSYNSFKNSERVEFYKCGSCVSKEVANRPGEKERLKKIASQPGEDNPMYGRSFYEVWVKKYGKEEADKRIKNWIDNLDENSGDKNPMYGRSFYEVWVKKYGKEEADKRMIKYKKTKSIQSKGEKNPMYGKPSPVGSGNGWSGWYKGWYFRSLRELSYMINVIERFNIIWESAETKKWSVKYIDWDGVEKNYFPDFILNNKYMIECKPKALWNSENVKLKKEAAIKKCKEIGLIYKIISPRKLKDEEIDFLYNKGDIKFLERYEEKYKNRLNGKG